MIQQVKTFKLFLLCVILSLLIAATVRFTDRTYSGSEMSGAVDVDVELVGGTSTVPFDVTVTPSQQSPPSATGDDVEYDHVLMRFN